MKKIICVFLSSLLLIFCLACPAYADDGEDMDYSKITSASVTPGDSNNDVRVSLRDVLLLLQFVSGWEVDINNKMADLDNDGQVTVLDAMLLLRLVNMQ